MTKVRFDFIPCIIIGGLLMMLVEFGGEQYIKFAENRYETQELPEGEVGGVPTADTPEVSSIAEMREHDKFFVTIDDGFNPIYPYNGKIFEAIELPSGEIVCAHINETADEYVGDYMHVRTPVGKIVPFEIPNVVESRLMFGTDETLSDATFYIDMYGDAIGRPDEDTVDLMTDIIGLVAFVFGAAVSHSIGVKIGLFPPVFPKRQK